VTGSVRCIAGQLAPARAVGETPSATRSPGAFASTETNQCVLLPRTVVPAAVLFTT